MKLFKTLLLTLVIPVFSIGQESAYTPGEKVNYAVHYGIVQGGTASLELKADTFKGKDVWHSVFIGRTTGMADAIFRVYDIYESYFEPGSGLPALSIRNISEGRYKRYNEVIFDHYTRADSAILTSDLTGVHTERHHDILSCFITSVTILPGYDTLKKVT
jgi:hypothetical protein